MRIVGPNCLGFANIHDNVYAAFGSITRAPKLERGNVTLVTQSGGFGYSIALACADAGSASGTSSPPGTRATSTPWS